MFNSLHGSVSIDDLNFLMILQGIFTTAIKMKIPNKFLHLESICSSPFIIKKSFIKIHL